jgi:hypothetical protein
LREKTRTKLLSEDIDEVREKVLRGIQAEKNEAAAFTAKTGIFYRSTLQELGPDSELPFPAL